MSTNHQEIIYENQSSVTAAFQARNVQAAVRDDLPWLFLMGCLTGPRLISEIKDTFVDMWRYVCFYNPAEFKSVYCNSGVLLEISRCSGTFCREQFWAELGEVCHCATAHAQQAQTLSQTVLTGSLQLTLFLVNPELHGTEHRNVYVPSHSCWDQWLFFH